MSDSIKILLVEDDIIDKMAFERLVKNQKFDYNYKIASSVQEAKKVLNDDDFDVVVLDYDLGDGTAFELIDDIGDTPFIFSTGMGEVEIAVKALQSGAFHYLVKDQSRNYLRTLPNTIDRAIEMQKMRIERERASKALIASENRYRSLQANLPVGIYRSNAKGELLFANPAMVKILGYDSLNELMSKPFTNTYANSEDRKKFIEQISKENSLRGFELELVRKDGSTIWGSLNVTAIKDENDLTYFDGVVEDITKRKQAEEALLKRDRILQALAEASKLFLTKTKWEEDINAILKNFVVALKISRIYIFQNNVDDDGELLMNLRYGWSSSQKRRFKNLFSRMQELSYRELGFKNWMKKIEQGKPVHGIVSELKEEAKFLQLQQIKSILIIPIFVEKTFWGFIGFDDKKEEHRWTELEVETLSMLGDIMGAAIKRTNDQKKLNDMYNSLLDELDIASSVQQYLLPNWLKIEQSMLFTSTYKPSHKIGGDLFDFIKISEKRYISYVGDVSGHGVQAALIMTAVKSIINMLINTEKEELQPYYVIDRLNKILTRELFHNNYLTLLFCLIDVENEEITCFNAGHPPLIEFDLKSKRSKILGEKGSIPIGWKQNFVYDEKDQSVHKFEENKLFLLFTDGIFECENPQGDQLGISGLIEFIEEETNFSHSIVLPHIFKQRLSDLDYDITMDDFTLIAFRKIQDQPYRKIYYLQSLLENTGPVGEECAESIRKIKDDSKLAIKVEIVINEFLNNIMEHGLRLKKETIIAMELTIEEEIILRFWDKGINWDLPEKVKQDDMINPRKFRGLGMQIIYSQAKKIIKNRYDEINETVIII